MSLLRSYLYAPGSKERVMSKALDAGADAVILDLEDAVPAEEKLSARRAVANLLEGVRLPIAEQPQIHVRINREEHGLDHDDVRAVVGPALSALRLPKVASAQEIAELADLLGELELRAGLDGGVIGLYPTIESAAAVLAAPQLASAPRVERLAFGATDFLADIAAPGTPDGPATQTARGMLVLASAAAGIDAPVDSVHTRLDDPDGLRRSALAARQLGFFGKSVIHPRQLEVVHEVFTPSVAEVEAARQVLEAAQAAAEQGVAATRARSEFVDPAVVARSRRVLALSGEGKNGA